MVEKTYKVSGMSCNHCVTHVKNAVEALEGVKSCSVDLKSESVKITFNEGKVNFGDIKAAVEDAGYELYED